MTNEQAGQAHWSLVDTCERSRVGHQRHYVNSVQFSYIAPYVPSRHLVSRRGDIGAVWRTEQN